MIGDLKDFIAVTLAKRMSSPFISNFLFTWAIFNYDFFITAFSSAEWDTKLSYIQHNVHFSRVYEFWGHKIPLLAPDVFYPILLTLFWIYIWPKLDRKIFIYTKKEAYKYKLEKLKAERMMPVKREVLDEFYLRMDKQSDEYKETLRIKDDYISELNNRFNEVNNRFNEINTRNNDLLTELNSLKEDHAFKMEKWAAEVEALSAKQDPNKGIVKDANERKLGSNRGKGAKETYIEELKLDSEEELQDNKPNNIEVSTVTSLMSNRPVRYKNDNGVIVIEFYKHKAALTKEHCFYARHSDKYIKSMYAKNIKVPRHVFKEFDLGEVDEKSRKRLVDLFYDIDKDYLNIPTLLEVNQRELAFTHDLTKLEVNDILDIWLDFRINYEHDQD